MDAPGRVLPAVRGRLAPAARHGRRRDGRRSRTSRCWRPRSPRRLALPAHAERLRGSRWIWVATVAFLALIVAASLYPLASDSEYDWKTHLVTAAKYAEYAVLAPAVVLLVRDARALARLRRDGGRSGRVARGGSWRAPVLRRRHSSARGRRAGGSRRSSAIARARRARRRRRSRSASSGLLRPGSVERRVRSPRSRAGRSCVVLSGGIAAELGGRARRGRRRSLVVLRARTASSWRRVGVVGALTRRLRPRRARAAPRRPDAVRALHRPREGRRVDEPRRADLRAARAHVLHRPPRLARPADPRRGLAVDPRAAGLRAVPRRRAPALTPTSPSRRSRTRPTRCGSTASTTPTSRRSPSSASSGSRSSLALLGDRARARREARAARAARAGAARARRRCSWLARRDRDLGRRRGSSPGASFAALSWFALGLVAAGRGGREMTDLARRRTSASRAASYYNWSRPRAARALARGARAARPRACASSTSAAAIKPYLPYFATAARVRRRRHRRERARRPRSAGRAASGRRRELRPRPLHPGARARRRPGARPSASCTASSAPGGRVLASTHGTHVYHPARDDHWRWTHTGLARLFDDERASWRSVDRHRRAPAPAACARACCSAPTSTSLAQRLHAVWARPRSSNRVDQRASPAALDRARRRRCASRGPAR